MWLKEEMQPGRQCRSCSTGGMYFLLGNFPFLNRQLCLAPAVTSKQISCNTCCKPQVKKEGDDCNETQNKLSQVIISIHQRHLCHLCLCVHPGNDRNVTKPEEQTSIFPNSDKLKHHIQFFLFAFSLP